VCKNLRVRQAFDVTGARLCLKDQPQRVNKRGNIRIGFQLSLAFGPTCGFEIFGLGTFATVNIERFG
jgi:hypothetical protein